MASQDHDTLVHRLAQILIKLNAGERLRPHDLAAEFNVDVRTVQRDLNQRLLHLNLVKVDGCYEMDMRQLGMFRSADISRFADLAGAAKLFPELSRGFLRQVLAEREQETLLVRGPHHEDIAAHAPAFALVREAIATHTVLDFELEGKAGAASKQFQVQPYRLLNHKGIWYLAGMHVGKLKHFTFTRMWAIQRTNETFPWDEAVAERIEADNGLWQTDDPLRVRLSVAAEAASYFRRRPLLPNQVIERELPDGGLEVTAVVGHTNEIFPIVRYWLPDVRILEPLDLRQALIKQLSEYAAS